MILITNFEVNTKESKSIYYVMEVYLTRWKCDECFRYIKQSYNLEDVRVRSYTATRNTLAFVHAIAYFTNPSFDKLRKTIPKEKDTLCKEESQLFVELLKLTIRVNLCNPWQTKTEIPIIYSFAATSFSGNASMMYFCADLKKYIHATFITFKQIQRTRNN